MKLMFKYNVKSRGTEGNDNTWAIHKDIDLGMEDILYTDHIEFKVPISTEEKQLGHGFGMICYGDIKLEKYPDSDKMFVIIMPEAS